MFYYKMTYRKRTLFNLQQPFLKKKYNKLENPKLQTFDNPSACMCTIHIKVLVKMVMLISKTMLFLYLKAKQYYIRIHIGR